MFELFLFLMTVAAAAVALVLFLKLRQAEQALTAARSAARMAEQIATVRYNELQEGHRVAIERLEREIASLARYRGVMDAEAAAERLKKSAKDLYDATMKRLEDSRAQAEIQARGIVSAAQREAEQVRQDTNLEARDKREKAQAVLVDANAQAEKIVQAANERAERIAGDAYRALQRADELKQVATAMKNAIDGYGDRYVKPTYGLLDELAETYGFDDAGRELKQARERSQLMVTHGRAAVCDYVEQNRKETAIRFVVDAFNGKVDSILAQTKTTNFGTLEQRIHDAFALVNNNGMAFRNARITPEYRDARLAELKWATAVHVLRERDKDEQRRIREQIREEEKARREIERAMKEAAREEDVLKKALEKAQAQVEKATDAQRAEYEAKLADLKAKLEEADARNRRALSMAQQTKAGHVYVISNLGSFGEDVFKVGMTRRLEPLDRVRELGDASVPFGFDVHAMIWSEDAPALENALHKQFVHAQVNKVNPRKEFFQVSLSALRDCVQALGIDAKWTLTAEAREYRESRSIAERLREDPAAARDWLKFQHRYEPATIEVARGAA